MNTTSIELPEGYYLHWRNVTSCYVMYKPKTPWCSISPCHASVVGTASSEEEIVGLIESHKKFEGSK